MQKEVTNIQQLMARMNEEGLSAMFIGTDNSLIIHGQKGSEVRITANCGYNEDNGEDEVWLEATGSFINKTDTFKI